jgi:hypothetical protein
LQPARLAEITGRVLVHVDGDHEIYLTDPAALTTLVVDAVGDPAQRRTTPLILVSPPAAR